MAWELITDTEARYVAWLDATRASGWIAAATARTSDAERDRLDRLTWREQRDATLEAWRAIGATYAALNLPPFADPDFRTLWARWYGRTTQPHDPQGDSVRGRISGSLWITDARAGAEIGRRVTALYRAAGGGLDADHYACNLDLRVNVTSNGTIATSCVAGDDPLAEGGNCYYRGFASGCVQDDDATGRGGCAPYTWRTLAWHDPPPLPGRAGAVCRIQRASVPLRWQFEAAQEFAAALARRSPREILTAARLDAVVRNAREADRLGLVNSAELRALAAQLPADLQRARWSDPTMKSTAAAMAALAAAAASIPGGQIYGAILGIAAAIVSVLPAAVGTDDDLYGRGLPLFEPTSITGGPTNTQRPTHTVPEPPAASRALHTIVPTETFTVMDSDAPDVDIVSPERFHEVRTSPPEAVAPSKPPTSAPMLVVGGLTVLTLGLLAFRILAKR